MLVLVPVWCVPQHLHSSRRLDFSNDSSGYQNTESSEEDPEGWSSKEEVGVAN